jgi:hypothetical protein
MINIGIYNTSWGSFGGGEKYISLIASILSKLNDVRVTLLMDNTSVTSTSLSAYYNIDLGTVEIRNIGSDSISKIMHSFDVGIITSNVRSFGNHAKCNVYILQIPYYKITPINILTKSIKESPKEGIKDILRLTLLQNARESELVLVYSEFTKNVLQNITISIVMFYIHL